MPGRVTIDAIIDQLTVKDGIKAVVKVPASSQGIHDLIDCQGRECLLVIGGAAPYFKGMDAVRGEEDQRALGLGEEYKDQ